MSVPSPVPAWSMLITWPDCSPPSTRSRRSSSSRTLRSPTGVPTSSMPYTSSARSQPEVGHHGGDDGVAPQQPAVVEVDRGDRDHLITVDQLALLVDRDHAVGVAVERQARLGARREHRRLELLGVRGTAARR